MTEDIHELKQVRLEKLAKMREEGIEPYGGRYERTAMAASIQESFAAMEGKVVRIAGRIMTRRPHGKAGFAHLQDQSGQIQLYFRQNDLGKAQYELYREMDIGDIIGVEGKVFKTRTGEITVHVQDFVYLAKSLRPLPEKWHGLKDVELRYRQRYVDLIVNPQVRDVFIKRTHIIREIRNFLDERGFLEVETPMMQPIAGGANARPLLLITTPWT